MSHTSNPQLEKNWSDCLSILRDKLGVPTFETFFKSSYPVSLQNNHRQIGVPNKLTKDWIERKFLQSVKDALSTMEQQNVQLEFTIDESLQPQTPDEEVAEELPRYKTTTLNSKFTFSTFVVGSAN